MIFLPASKYISISNLFSSLPGGHNIGLSERSGLTIIKKKTTQIDYRT